MKIFLAKASATGKTYTYKGDNDSNTK